MDFSKFDNEVNKEQLMKDYAEAKENGGTGDYEETPAGAYIVRIENMEIRETKETKEPMFSCQCRIVEAMTDEEFADGTTIKNNDKAIEFMKKFKKDKTPCLFFNRKIYGNKVSDKWNDGKAIATVTGWLDKLETETVPIFESYSQFNDCVLDIFEECNEYKLLLEVDYKPDAFNPISIKGVFEE